MNVDFDLFLFSKKTDLLRASVAAGVRGVIVDWEYKGKDQRQKGFDTQINCDSLNDLKDVRQLTQATVICRINEFGESTPKEVEDLIQAGADELLLPMVRSVGQVEQVLRMVKERCKVGILVETCQAVALAHPLGKLPLSRVYVGLNDLAIDRIFYGQYQDEIFRQPITLFSAVADGTVERVREQVKVPFGFAGLTLPEGGSPIPCRLLIAEMARLDCQFSFLRRSFLHDIQGRDPGVEISRILRAIHDAKRDTLDPVFREKAHQELVETIDRMTHGE